MIATLLATFLVASQTVRPPSGPSHWLLANLVPPPGVQVRLVKVTHIYDRYQDEPTTYLRGYVVDLEVTMPGYAKNLDTLPNKDDWAGQVISCQTTRATWHLNFYKVVLQRYVGNTRRYFSEWRSISGEPTWNYGTVTLRGRNGGKIVLYP